MPHKHRPIGYSIERPTIQLLGTQLRVHKPHKFFVQSQDVSTNITQNLGYDRKDRGEAPEALNREPPAGERWARVDYQDKEQKHFVVVR